LDPWTGRVLGRLDCRLPRDPTEGFRQIILGPGGRYAAEVFRADHKDKSWPAQVRVWDVASGRPLYEFHDRERPDVGAGFSPDGAHLVTVSAGFTVTGRQRVPGQVRLCEAAGGQEILSIPCTDFKTGPLLAEFSPDGRKLVLSDQTSHAEIWDVPPPAHLPQPRVLHGDPLEGLRGVPVFSPDGKLLAGRVERDGRKEVQVWGLSTAPEAALAHGRTFPGARAALAFSPESRRLATWDDAEGICVWDVLANYRLLQIKQPISLANAGWGAFVSFSPDGRVLMMPGPNGTTFWDALSGEERFTVPGVILTRFSPDGTRLLGCDWSGVKVWDRLAVEQPTQVLPPCEDGRTAAFSAAAGRTALADGAGVRLLDTAGRELTALRGHTRPVCCLAFSADGERLASAAQDLSTVDHTAEIKVWDLRAGRELFTVTRPAEHPLARLTFSPDGRSLAVTEKAPNFSLVTPRPEVVARIDVRETTTGAERFALPLTNTLRAPAVFVGGGDSLAIVAGNRLTVHDAATGREVRSAELLPVPDPNDIVRREPWATAWAVFSPDGNTLAVFVEEDTRKPGEVQLWDVPRAEKRSLLSMPASLQRAQRYPRPVEPRGRPMAWDPAGTRLAACHGEDVAVWDAATARLVHRLITGAPVKRLAWTPDGQRLVTAEDGERGQVKLWDAETGAEVLTLKDAADHRPGTEGGIDQLAFRPDGGLLVLSQHGGRFRVWEAAPSTPDRPTWHLLQAEQAIRDEGQLKEDALKPVRGPVLRFAVAQHLRHLEGLDFDSADLYHRRGGLYAHLGRWAQAAADFRRAVERKTTYPEAYHYLALLTLKAGDRGAYRRTCRLLLERLGGLPNRGEVIRFWPGVNDRISLPCRTCTLADGALDDYTPLIHLAEKVSPVSLGPVLYRAGQVARAEEVLRKALTSDDATIHLFLRMAKHRQGKKADIAAELEEARKQKTKDAMIPVPKGSPLAEWAGAMEWAILQAEAEERLRK
jgi:WD40 repeat protein/tetratricopeptide (TPR) repeat protein